MLSWLDQRALLEAEALAERLDPAGQVRLFGSIITAKDVVPKVEWLRDRRPEAWSTTRWLLDCKEAIVLRLTGRAVDRPALVPSHSACTTRSKDGGRPLPARRPVSRWISSPTWPHPRPSPEDC